MGKEIFEMLVLNIYGAKKRPSTLPYASMARSLFVSDLKTSVQRGQLKEEFNG
jgi:hypothetical protein